MIDVIKSNSKGKLAFNKPERLYCIEFGTIELKMDHVQLRAFKNAVSQIDLNQPIENRYHVVLVNNKITLRFSREEAPFLFELLGLQFNDNGMIKMKMDISMN